MANTAPPKVDSTVSISLFLPTGLILTIPIDHFPVEQIRDAVRCNTPDDDIRAAIEAARHTGLDATVQRNTQTTVRVTDLEY